MMRNDSLRSANSDDFDEDGASQQDDPHPIEKLQRWAQSSNIVGDLSKDQLSAIGARVVDEWQIDRTSRADWEHEARLAMDAVVQKVEQKDYPFTNASNVKYPLMTTAALQYNARAYPAIISDDRVVKAKVLGPDPDGLKVKRAERISMHMSRQLLDLPNWQEDVDTLTSQQPVLGDGFMKVYHDAEQGRHAVDMVSAMHVIVSQSTKSLERCPRITHEFERYPHEIDERIAGGTFAEFDYGSATPEDVPTGDKPHSTSDADAPHLFLEQHRLEDLDGDGMREPWIITVHKATGIVVRIVANFDVEKIRMTRDGKIIHIPRRDFFVHFPFLPDPAGGFYGIGFGRLLRAIGEAVNTTLNQLLDAGHLQNAGGGFIGSGLNLKKAELRIQMNEWTHVPVTGQNIRDAIVPHQFAGPSPVLFQLLGLLTDAAKQIASVQDVLTGESRAQTMQPTTLLALIEQGLKVFTSIIKRLFRSLGRLYKMLYALNGRYPNEDEYARIIDWTPPKEIIAQLQQLQKQSEETGAPMPPIPDEIKAQLQTPTMQGDYEEKSFDIVPAADPSQVTDVQKMAKAQVVMDTAQKFPQTVNPAEALKRIYIAAGIEDADRLIQQQQGPDPMMAEMAKAKIEDARAGSMKKLAEADKITAETHATTQKMAADHAQFVAGATDQNAELDAAMKKAQIAKIHHESDMTERQQQMQERLATQQPQSTGE